MNNKEYGDLVNSGAYPNDIEVPLDKPFVDSRGIIQNLWLSQSGSITIIDSNKGAIRAQHKHTLDWHTAYIISGSLLYVEGEDKKQITKQFNAGSLFFTRPGVYHEMHFLEDCKMITVNNMCKNHENYEKDVKRKKESIFDIIFGK